MPGVPDRTPRQNRVLHRRGGADPRLPLRLGRAGPVADRRQDGRRDRHRPNVQLHVDVGARRLGVVQRRRSPLTAGGQETRVADEREHRHRHRDRPGRRPLDGDRADLHPDRRCNGQPEAVPGATLNLAARQVVLANVPPPPLASAPGITCTYTNTYTPRSTLTLVKQVHQRHRRAVAVDADRDRVARRRRRRAPSSPDRPGRPR